MTDKDIYIEIDRYIYILRIRERERILSESACRESF